jgi:hypothetical protein
VDFEEILRDLILHGDIDLQHDECGGDIPSKGTGKMEKVRIDLK